MQIKLVGYIKSSEQNEENIFIKIPVFTLEEKLVIQKSELFTNRITGFQEISKIPIESIAEDTNITVAKGSDAIFIIKFKEELFIGNKITADRIIVSYIEEKDLSKINLFSLYTFLGLRDKVIETVNNIIIEHPTFSLTHDNFVIPEAIEVNSVITKDSVYVEAFNSFSNIFYELSEMNYGDIIQRKEIIRPSEKIVFKIGLYHFYSTQVIASLGVLLFSKPKNHAEIRINDFTIGLLIFAKIDLPKNIQIFKYFSFELIQSAEYMDNDIIANIRDLQIRSSTNYYRYDPDALTGSMSLVYLSQRLDKEFEKKAELQTELSSEEVIENEAIKNHIIEANSI